MFRATSSQAVIAALALVIAACGGQEGSPQGDTLGSSDAKVVQTSTSEAVKTAVIDHLLADLGAWGQGDTSALIKAAASGFDIDGLIPGELGGSFGLAGQGKALGDLLGGGLGQLPGFSLDLQGTFDQWKAKSGVILDGTVALDVKIESVLPIKVSVRVKGLIDVSGAVQGKVDLDLSIDFGADGLPDVCGLVAGQGFDLTGCAAGQGLPGLPGLPGIGTGTSLRSSQACSPSPGASLPRTWRWTSPSTSAAACRTSAG